MGGKSFGGECRKYDEAYYTFRRLVEIRDLAIYDYPSINNIRLIPEGDDSKRVETLLAIYNHYTRTSREEGQSKIGVKYLPIKREI